MIFHVSCLASCKARNMKIFNLLHVRCINWEVAWNTVIYSLIALHSNHPPFRSYYILFILPFHSITFRSLHSIRFLSVPFLSNLQTFPNPVIKHLMQYAVQRNKTRSMWWIYISFKYLEFKIQCETISGVRILFLYYYNF